MAKNHLHFFSVDLQSLEPAIFGNDMPFAFFRVVDRGKAGDDAVGSDHSQNIKALNNCASVGHVSFASLTAPPLPRDMRVGGLVAHEILKMEILDLPDLASTHPSSRTIGH